MTKEKIINKRNIKQDSIYHSKLVSMIINKILKNGKKTIAEKIFYSSMLEIEKKTKKKPMEILEKAIKNITPSIELKSKRVGGSIYSIPTEITTERGTSIALKFLIKCTREKHNKSSNTNFLKTLTNEIIDASNNLGSAVKKKEEIHKTANANRVFTNLKSKK